MADPRIVKALMQQTYGPGYLSGMTEADINATDAAQAPPIIRPNQQAFEDAVASMPMSRNVENRTGETPQEWAQRLMAGPPDMSPQQRVEDAFSIYGSPLGRQAGLNDIGASPRVEATAKRRGR